MLNVGFYHPMGHSYMAQIDGALIIGLIGQEIIS